MGILKDLETFLLSAADLADNGVPSISIAWRDHPSAPVQSHTISQSGRENTETVYQACSISKAITALAVAKLIDQNRLSYETRVIPYIPESIVQSIGSPHLMQLVTVGHLLSHTSGLTQGGFPGYASSKLPTYEELFAGKPPCNTPRIRFKTFPGTEMSYSGGGFTVLQLFLEKFTGLPFAEFMLRTVLEPLGMHRSSYGDISPQETNYAKAHTTAYTLGTDNERGYHYFFEQAAAGLWTTPSDLLKATTAVQTSLYPSSASSTSSPPFLSQATAIAMLTRPKVRPNDKSMAMGFCSDDQFFAHSGENYPGYTCYLIAGQQQNLNPTTANAPPILHKTAPNLISCALMTNSILGVHMYRKIISAFFAMRFLVLPPTLPSFGSTTDYVPLAAPEGIVAPTDWKNWVGTWEDGWEIYDDEGKPMVLFEGVEGPHRLLFALSSGDGWCYRVEGLELAVRLLSGEEKTIEIVGTNVKGLKRV